MHLIVGLGNPGERYEKSRHNVGFILLDDIENSFQNDKYANALVSQVGELVYVKPQTFMNNSGSAISHLVDKYELSANNVLVIYDDVDMPF